MNPDSVTAMTKEVAVKIERLERSRDGWRHDAEIRGQNSDKYCAERDALRAQLEKLEHRAQAAEGNWERAAKRVFELEVELEEQTLCAAAALRIDAVHTRERDVLRAQLELLRKARR